MAVRTTYVVAGCGPLDGTRDVRTDRNSPLTCLVAEDQALIAMLLQEELEEAGFAVIGPFPSCSEALGSLQTVTPAFALIDYMLADGPCVDLARALRRRNVPFAILSGYDQESRDDPAEWDDALWLHKPITPEPLRRAICKLAPTS